MDTSSDNRTAFESAGWCVFYGAGIIGMLVIYGLLQERIMSLPYGDPPMMFTDSVMLVFCNRVVAIIFALCMVAVKGESFQNKAPLWKYLAISFSSTYASACQYEALKYVSFPVQMLGKSFKMMPVMLWGIVISQQTYKLKDWAIAAGVTGGVTAFLMGGDIKSKHANQDSSVYGLLLLCAFLAADGFTSTFQEKLFKEHKTSKYNQMLYVNSGSAVVSAGTLLVSGGSSKALEFISRHPAIMGDASLLSASAVGGQFFIYSLVKEFGALALAATMNVRQVLSILVSYMIYSHSISLMQVSGLIVVFGTLFYKSYLGYLKSQAKAASACPNDSPREASKLGRATDEEMQALKSTDKETANGDTEERPEVEFHQPTTK